MNKGPRLCKREIDTITWSHITSIEPIAPSLELVLVYPPRTGRDINRLLS